MATIERFRGKWRARIRRKGRKPISQTFPTKTRAKEWADKIEAHIKDGKAPTQAAHEGITIAQLITKYRALREGTKPVLDTSTEHCMLNQLEAGLGDKDAMTMTVDDLRIWCVMRRDEGAGPYTVNMNISKLSTVMLYTSASLDIILPDVVGRARPLLHHLGLIGGGGKRDRRPEDDELMRLLAYLLEHHENPRYADAVVLAANAPLRRSEICRVPWADLDEGKRAVLVRDRKHPRRKKGNDVWVALSDVALGIIWQQPRDDERIFPIHPQTLSKYFKAACDALSIPDLHLHDMKHEATSKLFEEGFDIPQVAALIGQSDWRILSRYTQLTHEKVRKG